MSRPAQSADRMIEIQTPGGDRYTRVQMTGYAIRELLDSPRVQVREVTREEAVRAAAARGVELPVVGPEEWDRPWFIVKGGIGLPNLLNAEIEVYVHPNWTVSAGYGVGLLPSVFSASVRWRPDATCFGCGGRNLFTIGFGIDGMVAPLENGNAEGLITASADAFYLHRFAEHFGWLIGIRLGIGPTIGGGGSPEPGLNLFLYTGFAF
jgi:hypothetical protein